MGHPCTIDAPSGMLCAGIQGQQDEPGAGGVRVPSRLQRVGKAPSPLLWLGQREYICVDASDAYHPWCLHLV